MSRAHLSVALLAIVCSVYVSSIPLPILREISSTSTTWSATLSIEMHRHTSSQVNFTSRQYCYEGVCGVPGPILRFKPGDQISLTLQNNLAALPAGAEEIHNHFHSPNQTNLHTHGLHISANEDLVLVPILPGTSKTYNYNIFATHLPGTHWYHSHLHGASALHMAGGMVGALIMDPTAAATLPASLTNVAETIIVMTAHKFNRQYVEVNANLTLPLQACFYNDGYDGLTWNPQHVESYDELGEDTGSAVPASPSFADESIQELILLNGEYIPTITIKKNEQHILRMVHANGFYSLDASLPGCTIDVIAADGVYYTEFRRVEIASFTSGGRLDLLIQCSNNGTFYLESYYGQPYERINQTLLVIEVTSVVATPATTLVSSDLAMITRPVYLQNLMNETAVDHLDVSFIQAGNIHEVIGDTNCGYWIGTGPDCSNVSFDFPAEPQNYLKCRYQPFPGPQGGDGTAADPPPAAQQYHFVTATGRVNEWRIYQNDAHRHPFHLHVYHIQIIGFTPSVDQPDEDYSLYFRIGDWRDTIPTMAGTTTVRFRPLHFSGETVMHCHWLPHEDIGMMSTVYVCDTASTGGVPGVGSCPASNIAHTVPSGGDQVQIGIDDTSDQFSWGSVGGVFAIIAMAVAGLALVTICIYCFVHAVKRDSIVQPPSGAASPNMQGTQMVGVGVHPSSSASFVNTGASPSTASAAPLASPAQ